MFDLCAAGSPKEQEELRCQVLSGYAIICQEAGATPASWRDHTRCGEALTFPSSRSPTLSAISALAQLRPPQACPPWASRLALGSPTVQLPVSESSPASLPLPPQEAAPHPCEPFSSLPVPSSLLHFLSAL